MKLFGSGKAAFRFLIPREAVLADPVTKPIGDVRKGLVGWYGTDRRIIMYACNDDELLNFVCIHPDTESHADPSDGTPLPFFPLLQPRTKEENEWSFFLFLFHMLMLDWPGRVEQARRFAAGLEGL